MAGPIALLVVLALAFVVALVLITAKLERRKAEHQREMQDLVRGRTGRPATLLDTTPDAPQFGGVSSVFTTKPGAARSPSRQGVDAAETAALIQQLQAITATAKGNKTPTKADDAAMLRRAQQAYEEAVAEAMEFNRGTKARQPGPCTLQINYVDADGVWTTRNVAPYKSGNTNERFDAWCETRQDRRTFFFSRVQSGMNLHTGQRLGRADIFKVIHPNRKTPIDLL